jgi:hypothetical protein
MALWTTCVHWPGKQFPRCLCCVTGGEAAKGGVFQAASNEQFIFFSCFFVNNRSKPVFLPEGSYP